VQLERVKQMTLKDTVVSAFEKRFKESPGVVIRAPGRVNLMGGHTDYTGGYVLPVTIDRYVVIALRAREDGQVAAFTPDGKKLSAFDMTDFDKSRKHTDNLLKAVAWALAGEGYSIRGWEGVIGTELAGEVDYAEDAALMLAAMMGFSELSGFPFEAQASANIADKAYTDYIGRRSLLPALYSITMAEPGHATLLDMQNLDVEAVPFSRETRLVMADSGVKQEKRALNRLIDTRILECATAAQAYKVGHLRDLSMSRFEKDADDLDETVSQRARHFLTENGRTILAGEMMRSGAFATVGKLMLDSHTSLRDEYEVGDETIDSLLACVMDQPNVYGARWSGYGGGVVALVRDFSADTISTLIKNSFKGEAEIETAVLDVAGPVALVNTEE
jgi:galactokinase